MIISCIIAVYNEEKYILRCLTSLNKQKLDFNDQLEIIVVDDGSNDSSRQKVKSFGNIKLLSQNHLGAGAARNAGVKYARGEIYIFVDADMEFEQDFVKNLISPIQLGQAKGTYSKEEYVANWQNPIARCWNWNENLPEKKRIPTNAIGTDFRAILAEEFSKVKGYEPGGYTDTWSLYEKLGYKPKPVAHAKYYHYNPDSLMEAFKHAKWVGKRKYKLGPIGSVAALIRVSLPVSLIQGFYKAIKYHEVMFVPFKVVWDAGLSWGIIKYSLSGAGEK